MLPSGLQHTPAATRIKAIVKGNEQRPLRLVIQDTIHIALDPFGGVIAVDQNELGRHIGVIQRPQEAWQDG